MLEIDRHARQITISLRNDGGDVVLTGQIKGVRAFFVVKPGVPQD